MSYSVGFEGGRWIGYGVPSECDHPECKEEINRGMGYQVKDGVYIYCCEKHRHDDDADSYEPKQDSDEWVNHLLVDESWSEWREINPQKVLEMSRGKV